MPDQASGAGSNLGSLIQSRIQRMRPKLLDLSRRNPLISTTLSHRTNSVVRVVDELSDQLLQHLLSEGRMRFAALPPLSADPRDEKNAKFQTALSQARRTDEAYSKAIEALDPKTDGSIDAAQKLERELRDRVRLALGMAPRQAGQDISLPQHAANNGISASYDLPKPDATHEDGRHADENIQTLFLPEDLERKLNALVSKCRTWTQETGINVLHAAFGFLEWAEPNASAAAFAPLVLLPVEIEKKKSRDGAEFWVGAIGEDVEANAVLAEKLRLEFGVELPKYEGGSLEAYFALVSEVQPKALKWRVRRQVAFGVFPSARLAMYMDLDKQEHQFEANGVIASLLGGSEVAAATPFADEYETDAPDVEKKVPCLVMDADASQFSTIVDVADGKNLAVEGPPGTGKSQTIVNTIAAALAAGKKVLFVAEKMAALEVVKARLEMVGLGEFVLPLQAERSGRGQVIQSLRERLAMDAGRTPSDYEDKVEKYRQVRSELAAYLSVIGKPFGRIGLTTYEILGRDIAVGGLLESAPSEVRRPSIADVHKVDREKIQRLRDVASAFEIASQGARETGGSWSGLTVANIDKFTADNLLELASKAVSAAEKARTARTRLADVAIPVDANAEAVGLLFGLLRRLEEGVDQKLLGRLIRSGDLDPLKQFLSDCARVQGVRRAAADLLTEPGDEEGANYLREASSICVETGLSHVTPVLLRERVETARQEFAAKKRLYKQLEPFIRAAPACAPTPLALIAEAHQIIAAAGGRALALRSEHARKSAGDGSLSQLCRRGKTARAKRDEIKSRFASIPAVPIDHIEAHAATLRDAQFFDKLGSKYRAAKNFYRSLGSGERFESHAAAVRMHALADARKGETTFESHAGAQQLFAGSFAGVDTEFEPFEALERFYQAIDASFVSAEAESLRLVLRSGGTDILRLLPDLEAAPLKGSFHDLVARLRTLQAEIGAFSRKADRLEELSKHFKDPNAVSAESALEVGNELEQANRLATQLDQESRTRSVLGERFSGANTLGSAFEAEFALASDVRAAVNAASVVLTVLDHNTVTEAILCTRAVLEETQKSRLALEALRDAAGIDFPTLMSRKADVDGVVFLTRAASDRAGVMAHSKVATARAEMTLEGADWVLRAYEAGGSTPTGLPKIVEATYFRAMAIQIYREFGAVLGKYPGEKLDELRASSAQLDRTIIQMSRRYLRERISKGAKPPRGISIGKKSEWTELALINNETSKTQRYVPFRDLVRRSARALQELKPCWMMSPLAVAQYLPAGRIEFDLCIIDEASQMPPEDALGALVRCKQAMVVGDTNQLPPSSFFKKMLDDDEADEDETVFEESVLELANGAFRPARRLRWHYRSRHSGLIQFSNQHVYDGDLVVFPSAAELRPDMGVSLVAVEGRYKSGVNPDEAQKMVEAALEFMGRRPDQSLGIVTLNQKQRDLLQEEWENALSRDTVAAAYVEKWAKDRDGIEEFFIKKNVQGDERDVIFIGTVYGPENQGAPVMQRFGPINGVAGKRRLNVLFSRAKQQIVTFSSMTGADIRADENGNVGAYMLKRWLEYSATGQLLSGESTHRSPDSDFEVYVIDQLRAMGCEPEPQVGAAGYFIDIGVKHPTWPHGYILAVECDGASYHSSRSARDRDRLRQEVLEGLGWRFHRIWSTDWFNDPRREAERLRSVVEDRLSTLLSAEGAHLKASEISRAR